MKMRRICVFTGNRAEYGLQYPILRALASDTRLEYFLLVSGAHLLEDFGRTVAEIERDGFHVHRQIRIDMEQDSLAGTARAIGSGILNLSHALEDVRPEFLIVYADRFEGFAAVIAGSQMNIPVAHVEGGDLTEGGALDDSVRHAMTKLAHLHFTTNEQASERIRRMGEEPWRVHTVGLPALDLVAEGLYASPDEVINLLAIDLRRPIVLFTQHSVTTEFESAGEQVRPSLEAMASLAQRGYQVVITYPNNDAGGRRIIHQIEELARRGISNIAIRKSLGRYYFHGLLNVIGHFGRGACVGNSSGGIKETPAFRCPAVNIGSRQRGRLRADNILDVPYDMEAIVEAVRRCVEDETLRLRCQTCDNPYGAGDAGKRIADVLATIPIDMHLLQKRMTY